MGKRTSILVVAERGGVGFTSAEQRQGRSAKKREHNLSHLCSP
jgi:hypothetical protein